MIVAAIGAEETAGLQGLSFFDSIARKHQQQASEYQLVTQPDHARLSGAIAGSLDRSQLTYVTDEIVQAVETHDIGWVPIDGVAPEPILPPYDANGHLRSFLTTPPVIFLNAWAGSISHAEGISPAAGIMVSRHFERLAQFRLHRSEDTLDDTARMHHFLAHESARQLRLQKQTGTGASTELLTLLQLCDLISLYLCCGLETRQELTQDLGSGPIAITRRNEVVTLHGVPLRESVQAQCPAFRWRPGSPMLLPSSITVRVEPA